MQRLGLPGWQWRLLLATLATTHERRIRVTLMDLDHKVLREFEPVVLEGQVTVDSAASPSRTLNLSIVDPDRTLGFEGRGDDIGTYRSRMVQVTYRVNVATVGWVDCRVFCGPIFNLVRDDAVVTIEAEGKERLALGAQWKQRTFKKKTRKSFAIRELAADAGERKWRLAVPVLAATTASRLTVLASDKPWPRMRAVAKSMGRDLFYDGRGFLVLRRRPEQVCHTFEVGEVLGPLSTTSEDPDPPNVFVVQGPKPKGKKKRVSSGPVPLPPSSSLSPEARVRAGRPYRKVSTTTNDQVKTVREAKFFAYQKREDALRATEESSVEVLPFPMLDEGDRVRVRYRTAKGVEARTFRPRSFTIPLADGGMGLGSTARTGERLWTSKKPKSIERRKRRAARKRAAAKKAAARKRAAKKAPAKKAAPKKMSASGGRR